MRFRLRTLIALTVLAAIVAWRFSFDFGVGILTYIGCLFVTVIVTRMVAAQRFAQPGNDPKEVLLPDPVVIFFVSLAVALAAAIAFCATCSAIQLPFTFKPEIVHLGLFLSIPLGTLAALLVYWLTRPRPPASAGRPVDH